MLDLVALQLLTFAVAASWTLRLRVRPLNLVPMTLVMLHVVILQLWVFLTNWTVGLNVPGWRIAMGAVALVGLWLLHRSRTTLREELRFWRTRTRRAAARLGTAWVWVLLVVPTGMFVVTAVAGWYVGVYIADVVCYHLVPPTDWVIEGKLVTRNWLDQRSFWPQGQGLLATVWGVTIHTLDSMVLAGLHWVALAITVAWALTRQMGGSVKSAMLSVLLVCAIPIVWLQGASGLNDLAAGAIALGATAVVSGRRVNRQRLWLTLILVSVGLGIKPMLLFMGPPIVLIAMVRWYRGRRVTMRSDSGLAWGLLVVAALFVGGYWYAQNVVIRPDHNPLYPASLRLGGVEIFAGEPTLQHHGDLSIVQLGKILADLVYTRGWDAIPLDTAQTINSTGWGPLVMSLGWAALIGTMIALRRATVATVAFLAMTLLICLAVEADLWFGRFFSFVGVFLVVCISLVTARLYAGLPRILWVCFLWTAGLWSMGSALAHCAPSGVMGYWFDQGKLSRIPGVVQWEPQFNIESEVEADTGMVILGELYNALYHGPNLTRKLVYVDHDPKLEDVRRWREDGMRWVLVSGLGFSPASLDSLGLIKVREGLYRIP